MVGYEQLRGWHPDTLEGSARDWRRLDERLARVAERLRRELRRHRTAASATQARGLALADAIAATGRTAFRIAAELSRAGTELAAARAELAAAVTWIGADARLRISAAGDVAVVSPAELTRLNPHLDAATLVSLSVAACDAAAVGQDRVDRALSRATVCDTATARRLRELWRPAAVTTGEWRVRFAAEAGLGGEPSRRLRCVAITV